MVTYDTLTKSPKKLVRQLPSFKTNFTLDFRELEEGHFSDARKLIKNVCYDLHPDFVVSYDHVPLDDESLVNFGAFLTDERGKEALVAMLRADFDYQLPRFVKEQAGITTHRTASLCGAIVLEQLQRLGIMGMFVEHLHDIIYDMDYDYSSLTITKENLSARNFANKNYSHKPYPIIDYDDVPCDLYLKNLNDAQLLKSL